MSIVKLKNREVLDLYSTICGIDSNGKNLSVVLTVNKAKLKLVFDAINEQLTTKIDEIKDYQIKRDQIINSYGAVDAIGNTIRGENGTPVIPKEREKEFTEAISKFDNDTVAELVKNGAIEKRKQEVEECNKMLDEETEVDLIKISYSYIPDNLSEKQLTSILPMVKENLEQISEMIEKL